MRNVWPGAGLLVLANRDEDPRRLSAAARVRRCLPDAVPGDSSDTTGLWADYWLGGRDRRAGGTWLGINDAGLLVAITNRPETGGRLPTRSRGLLCRDLLCCRSPGQAGELAGQLIQRDQYAGLNLAISSASETLLGEVSPGWSLRPLTAELCCLGNGPADDPDDPRLESVRRLVVETVRDPASAIAVCRGHDQARPSRSACRHTVDRSTVSSAVMILSRSLETTAVHWAQGPPCRTPFQDLSGLAHEMLGHPPCPSRSVSS